MVLVRAISLTPATLYTSWRVPLSTLSLSLSLTQLGVLTANLSSYQPVNPTIHYDGHVFCRAQCQCHIPLWYASVICIFLSLTAHTDSDSESSESSCSDTPAIIGGVVAIVLIVTTALTVIVIVLVLRSRKGDYSTRSKRYKHNSIYTLIQKLASEVFLYHSVRLQLFLELLTRPWSSQNSQKKQLTRMYISECIILCGIML